MTAAAKTGNMKFHIDSPHLLAAPNTAPHTNIKPAEARGFSLTSEARNTLTPLAAVKRRRPRPRKPMAENRPPIAANMASEVADFHPIRSTTPVGMSMMMMEANSMMFALSAGLTME